MKLSNITGALLCLIAALASPSAYAVPKNLNAPNYVLSATTSSSSVTLVPQDAIAISVDVYNAGSVPVFLTTGTTSAPTAVFPTSATVPIAGTVVAPGAILTLSKREQHEFISGITASGTASVYITVGTGE